MGANAVHTDCRDGGGASCGKAHGGSKECYLFSAGFSEEDSFVFVMSTNVRGR